MDDSRYILLLHKKFTNSLSPQEAKDLDQWLSAGDENAREALYYKKIWSASESYKQTQQPDTSIGLLSLKDKIEQARQEEGTQVIQLRPNRMRWLWAAAIAVMMATVAVWFYTQTPQSDALQFAQTSQYDVQQLTLPDGSIVWLNQNSRLDYPENFSSRRRMVKLSGEAFFDVKRNTEKPFLIETPSGKVEVLGTSFNIRAYPTEKVEEVHVATGKVRYAVRSINAATNLEKGQMAQFDRQTKKLSSVNIDNFNSLAWQTGKIQFKGEPLREVLQTVQRVFQVHIDLTEIGPVLDCPVTTNIKKADAEEVLKNIQTAFDLDLEKTDASHFSLMGGQDCQPNYE
jgi:transmembrane sensor